VLTIGGRSRAALHWPSAGVAVDSLVAI